MKFVFRWAVAYFVFDAVVMRLVSYNGEFTDDNAADSYSLAHLVSGQHELAYEKEVFDKLQDPKFRER